MLRHFADCRYAERRHSESRVANFRSPLIKFFVCRRGENSWGSIGAARRRPRLRSFADWRASKGKKKVFLSEENHFGGANVDPNTISILRRGRTTNNAAYLTAEQQKKTILPNSYYLL
jgi:hypothetical protein